MSDFWQAPGNGKGFDSFLGDNSKMNNRTIGVLSYIKENSMLTGFVSEIQFKDEIKTYLLHNFNEDPNDSLDTHFYKPSLFYGFIQRNKDKNLSLSIEGNLFLTHYKNNNYSECKKLIINQLDNTTYPNEATKKIKNLKLFPFRILFKILLENKEITSKFINTSLVHIKKKDDLGLYEQTKNINDIPSYEEDSSKFIKFNTWVINSLVNLQILKQTDIGISIHEDSIEHIKSLYINTEFSDMFFETTTHYVNELIGEKRTKRDSSLIYKAKERDQYKCNINNNHITFISKGNNYVEGHHVIPIYQQKNYPFGLDTVDNIISLCPNCHREIHSADDKTTIIKELYKHTNDFMQSNNIELNDLYKMYS